MCYKVGLVSLGCAKNRVDAEILLNMIKNAGYQIVEDVSGADIGIVNTCGFVEDSKKESIEEIFNLVNMKNAGMLKHIVVTGCLSERYKEEILKEIPEVDAVLGIGANKDIKAVLEEVLRGEQIESFPPKCDMLLSGDRLRTAPAHYAYLKVADGCDNCCTYCAIPLIRGKFRSRKMEDIIREAKVLSDTGVREIIVIAQDTTRYGEDIYDELKLPELLRELCKIEKIEWIRLLYCYPDRITDELIEVIKSEDKILKYMDLPLQHCSSRILKAMNRRGDKNTLMALLSKIKSEIPGVVIRTTFIVGFPGETEEDFSELCEFVGEIKFDRMGCFCYSKEEDTKAAEFENQVEDEIKLRRREILMLKQAEIMDQKQGKMIGKKIKVLVEGFDQEVGSMFGRSCADSPDVDGLVYFCCNENCRPEPGTFVTVLVNDFIECDLLGEMI